MRLARVVAQEVVHLIVQINRLFGGKGVRWQGDHFEIGPNEFARCVRFQGGNIAGDDEVAQHQGRGIVGFHLDELPVNLQSPRSRIGHAHGHKVGPWRDLCRHLVHP